jgi:hypothetical protein
MWTRAKRALAARAAAWKRWTRAAGTRSAHLSYLFSFLLLVLAYAFRARAERRRWDRRLQRQAEAGQG